ncbi:hypothetical protein FRC02_010596 [Tulasnella sp. 418]|nr:hypothetical protein FRC02_010596 [Tulasnella sp. 418]
MSSVKGTHNAADPAAKDMVYDIRDPIIKLRETELTDMCLKAGRLVYRHEKVCIGARYLDPRCRLMICSTNTGIIHFKTDHCTFSDVYNFAIPYAGIPCDEDGVVVGTLLHDTRALFRRLIQPSGRHERPDPNDWAPPKLRRPRLARTRKVPAAKENCPNVGIIEECSGRSSILCKRESKMCASCCRAMGGCGYKVHSKTFGQKLACIVMSAAEFDAEHGK